MMSWHAAALLQPSLLTTVSSDPLHGLSTSGDGPFDILTSVGGVESVGPSRVHACMHAELPAQ